VSYKLIRDSESLQKKIKRNENDAQRFVVQFFDYVIKVTSTLVVIIYRDVEQSSLRSMKVDLETKVKN